MKLIKKNVRLFNGFDEYADYYEEHEHFDHVTDVVEYSDRICADAEYSCKSCKTAVERFFKAIEGIEYFDGWKDWIEEACEGGWFKDKSTAWNDKTGRCEFTGDYHWEVEEVNEGCWYIELTVRK